MKEHDFMTEHERKYWNIWRDAIEQFAKLNLQAMGIDPAGHDIGQVCYELFRSALEYEHEISDAAMPDFDGGRLCAAQAVEHVRRTIAFNMPAVAQVYGILPIYSDGSNTGEGQADDC